MAWIAECTEQQTDEWRWIGVIPHFNVRRSQLHRLLQKSSINTIGHQNIRLHHIEIGTIRAQAHDWLRQQAKRSEGHSALRKRSNYRTSLKGKLDFEREITS